MNETLMQIKSRKSVRAFTNEEISKEKKAAIISAALEAPTAGNMTLYTIIDITDEKIKATLSKTCDNQPFIAEAKAVFVFCADCRRWYKAFERNCESVRKVGEGDLFLAMADTFIAAQNSVVAAEGMGIGSCYIGDITENFEIHKELLNLPKYVFPVCMLVFGYPTDQQKARKKPERFKAEDIVFENCYNEEKCDRMESMISERNGVEPNDVPLWISRFCRRKWNSDFSVEMTRSVRRMLSELNED